MKRKETTNTSPVKPKKGRASIGEIGSPTASSVEEQKRRALEWYSEQEKLKEASAASVKKSTKATTSTTPTSKVSSKKIKVEEPVAPRSTRKTAAAETSSKNRTLSAKVAVEWKENSEDDESEEEEVEPPVPTRMARKSVVKREKVIQTPIAAPAPSRIPTPKLTTPETKSSSSSRVPSRTTTPYAHPVVNASSGAKCPFVYATEPERETRPTTDHDAIVRTESSSSSSSSCSDKECEMCGISILLAAVPLTAIGFYDPKIAVTTLVLLFVVSMVRRIAAMAGEA